jgi:uncharacterized protein (DUF362 family)
MDPHAVFIYRHPLRGSPGWEDFRAAAHAALALMQVELEGESAVLKPNVTSGERFGAESGVITHPAFIQGMGEYLKMHGARTGRVSVVEDPRDSDDNDPRNWEPSGYAEAGRRAGLRLLTPKTYTCVKLPVPNPQHFPRLNVSRLAVDPNTVLFNVPKLKNHNLAITTLGMKNLMGLVNVFDRHYCIQAWAELPAEIRREKRPRYEWFTREMHELWQTGLAKRLLDTAQVLRPALNIVEGVVGREGTGFNRGRNRDLGLVVGGSNVVAVDSAASWLAGFDPQNLIYLRMAHAAGLGENDPAKLTFLVANGNDLEVCSDPHALRIDPSFRVISGIMGEDLDPFGAANPSHAQSAPQTGDENHDPIMSTVRSWKEALSCHSTSENAAS